MPEYWKMGEIMNVLLVTGKWPISNEDVDGGCQTTIDILETLHCKCNVDILLPQAFQGVDIPYVKKAFYFSIDKTEYIANYNNSNKFLERLKWTKTVSSAIAQIASNYDRIIIQHCFFAMNLDKLLDPIILKKLLVFPMFLTPDYQKSGENVPSQYTEMEEELLRSGVTILTPSEYSKKTILSFYNGINADKIIVCPRYIDDSVFQKKKKPKVHKPIRLIYVASIKLQKNNLEVIDVAKELFSRDINFSLYLVGPIQNTDYANQFYSALNLCPFKNKILVLGSVSHKELENLYSEMDLSISVSRCETFGRAIIEGLYCGLPAVVKDSIACFHNVVGEGSGIVYAKSPADMAQAVIECLDENRYLRLSQEACISGARFAKSSVQTKFWETLYEYKY